MYKYFQLKKLEYISNTLPEKIKTYPDGADIEIFTFKALKKMLRMKLTKDDKEHVTNKFWSSKNFKKEIYSLKKDFSNYRYTVDYKSDIIIIKYLINKLNKLNLFGNTNEIVKLINKSTKIQKIMKKNIVKQKKRRKKIFL